MVRKRRKSTLHGGMQPNFDNIIGPLLRHTIENVSFLQGIDIIGLQSTC